MSSREGEESADRFSSKPKHPTDRLQKWRESLYNISKTLATSEEVHSTPMTPLPFTDAAPLPLLSQMAEPVFPTFLDSYSILRPQSIFCQGFPFSKQLQ